VDVVERSECAITKFVQEVEQSIAECLIEFLPAVLRRVHPGERRSRQHSPIGVSLTNPWTAFAVKYDALSETTQIFSGGLP
jgi:hypothetical protein